MLKCILSSEQRILQPACKTGHIPTWYVLNIIIQLYFNAFSSIFISKSVHHISCWVYMLLSYYTLNWFMCQDTWLLVSVCMYICIKNPLLMCSLLISTFISNCSRGWKVLENEDFTMMIFIMDMAHQLQNTIHNKHWISICSTQQKYIETTIQWQCWCCD